MRKAIHHYHAKANSTRIQVVMRPKLVFAIFICQLSIFAPQIDEDFWQKIPNKRKKM